MTGSIVSVLVGAAMMVSMLAGPSVLAQATCGGFGAGQFNFGGQFQGGFQGGFNNFGGGNFQGGFQGFQFGSGFNGFGGGNFQGGIQIGSQGGQFQGGNFQGGFQLGFQGFPPGGFNFGGGGFQGGFNNFGSGGLNINSGVAPFGFNFGGAAGCPGGVFGLIPDGATVTAGDQFQYRLVWVSPTNWQSLEYLDLRIRDAAGNSIAIIRWLQGTDTYVLVDPATGLPIAQGPSKGTGILDSPNVSVVLAQSYSDNSGPTGQAVGLNATIVPKAPLAGRFVGVDVGSKNDGAAPTPFELAALLNIVAPELVQEVSANNDDEGSRQRKATEEQRQQRERTNRGSLDDYRTEGNAVESNCDAEWPTVTIASRDGNVVLRLLYDAKDSCKLVQPGDYVEVIGEKQNELLYDAHQLTVRRNGTRVR
jgi:hypothetical protein